MTEFKSTFHVDHSDSITKFIIRGQATEQQKKARLAEKVKVPIESIKLGNPKGHGSKYLKYDVVTLGYEEMLYLIQVARTT